jgi:hypothetical protein
MDPTIAAVLAKARALVAGLAGLPRRVSAAVPHGHFARDYNTLRKLALGAAPGLDERLLGKYVGVSQTPEGEFSQASYGEIEVYARQVVEQLALLVRAGTAGPDAGGPRRIPPLRRRRRIGSRPSANSTTRRMPRGARKMTLTSGPVSWKARRSRTL